MFQALRATYRLVDEHLFSRLSASAQIRLKRVLYAAGKAAFPSRLSGAPPAPEQLVRKRERRLALPDWAAAEMRELAKAVDPSLHPSRFLSKNPETYWVPYDRALAGKVYFELLSKISGPIDAILLVPWIKHGGADLGILHHARALTGEFGARTLVIATEPSPSPWAGRLPENVQFLEAGHTLNRLRHIEQDAYAVLARLLVQLAPGTVHVVGSRHAWETLRQYGQAISQQSSVFASLYCDEYDQDGCRDGYAVRYLARTHRWLTGVLTDNTASPRGWHAELGIDPRLFHVVPFPSPKASGERAFAENRPRLLWAGRLDRQKRPDLLERLARLTPEFQWDVHGTSVVPGHGADVTGLGALANVTLHGSYNDFPDIVRSDHLAFVYTSQWDGLPNVLLEAAASGLPIVAPDIGGISDLIVPERLVAPNDNIDAYLLRIRELASSQKRRDEYVVQQDTAIATRDWNGFIRALKRIHGYGMSKRQANQMEMDES